MTAIAPGEVSNATANPGPHPIRPIRDLDADVLWNVAEKTARLINS
jgi:hypothetical protein